MQTPEALFFGCWSTTKGGHFLYRENGSTIYLNKLENNIPWNEALMDTGLLKNGKHKDIIDGKVYWTLGGLNINCLWHSFFWWDRSGDKRSNSNSGFYTYGFQHNHQAEAFKFACNKFPSIIGRQSVTLKLQE